MKRSESRHAFKLTSIACLAGLAVAAVAVPTSSATTPDRHHHRTQEALDDVVEAGTPGAMARVDRGGRTWFGDAGVADRESGRPRLPVDHFRIASITKTFTAVVLLQLEADGLLSLDDSVESWLPGVVQGNGNDGRPVRLRQLLNHTSGIPNYNYDAEFLSRFTPENFFEHRFDGATPRELVDIALSSPPDFEPGKGWAYSDTNYILAGMVIEKATGHTYESEVRRRIIGPLGLHSTSLPGSRPGLPWPHGRHYSTLQLAADEPDPDAPSYDVTEFDPSVAWAAGTIISTTSDVNRFYRALLTGRLLEDQQQREMFTTVDVPEDDPHGGNNATYGLGVRSFDLSCGVTVWGHGGAVPGSLSRVAATRNGSHVLTLNRNGDWTDQGYEDAVVEAEFCP